MDINLRESLFSDGRMMNVVSKLGQVNALGNYVLMCSLAQTYWKRGKKLIPKKIWNLAKFPIDFIEFELAEEREDGFYVMGSNQFLDDEFISDVNKITPIRHIKPGREVKVSLDFLEPELIEFISGVSDLIRRRWLTDYSEQQISDNLHNCYEWCRVKGRNPKNVASLMNKFFEKIPKKRKLSKEVVGELESLLED